MKDLPVFMNKLHKKSILAKTFQFGFFTFVSRILGTVREILQIRLLGIGALSDAFIMAFRIPNSLRKVFAEGALSSAFVPSFIKIATHSENMNEQRAAKQEGSRLMSAAFLFFEGIVLMLCFAVWFFPHATIRLVASGFDAEQIAYASLYLRILFPFIFFISSSALLAGALQAENHFFMPAFSPVLLNIFYIGSLLLCLYFRLPITFLCGGILLGGAAVLLLYFIYYRSYGYYFAHPTSATWKDFRAIITKFGNCLFGVSVMELNFIIDGNIATYVGKGAASVLYFGSRFMQIPLSIFAVAFSTVMLSYFSRVLLYAPRRLNFLVLEATKFIVWVTVPAMFFLMFFSQRLFSTIIMTKGVSDEHIWQSAWVLIILSSGLLFFSLNKILTSIFYAFNDTWRPTLIGIFATCANFILNCASLFLPSRYALFGIAASTAFSGFVMNFFSFYYLYTLYEFRLPLRAFLSFLIRYLIHLFVVGIYFGIVHTMIFWGLAHSSWYHFFYREWGYWFVAFPLVMSCVALIYFLRKRSGIDLYFV